MKQIQNEISRCKWVPNDCELYIEYHDTEWGVPVYDDIKHFEFLLLESAQAGLSWLTILKRREEYKKAFAQFDPQKIALFDESSIQILMEYKGIIRNKLKILSAINNAKLFLHIQKEFGSFNKYIWQFVDGKTIHNHWKSTDKIPAQSKESQALSCDLRKRGFTFVGPIVMYSHMQATGLVNDHTVECFRYREILQSS